MHSLLTRQLARLGLTAGVAPDAAVWQQLLEQLSQSFDRADQQRELVERSMALSSVEMCGLQENLRQANEAMEARVAACTAELLRERTRTALALHLSQVLHKLRDQAAADTAGFLNAATQAAARTLRVERASVWLFDTDRSGIVCRDLFNAAGSAHESGLRLAAADYPRYFAALTGGAVLDATDARTDPRTSEFADGYLRQLGITSVLDAPLRLGRHLHGVLCLEHTGPVRQWSSEEKTFAQALAGIVMQALEQDVVRRAQSAQQTAERQLHALLDGMPDCAWLKDTEGRFLAINSSDARAHGHTVAELIGKTALDVLPAEIANALMAEDRAAMAEPGATRVERAALLGEGWLEIIRVPMRDADGVVQGLVSISRDITARKEAERALIAAKEAAERASAAKDTFLATMSHEIRTPMNGLMGTLELLALSNLDREQSETLAIARQSGHALGRIIDDILGHAKIEADKLALVLEPVAQVAPEEISVAAPPAKVLDLKLLGDPDGDDKEEVLELIYAVRDAMRAQIPEVTSALESGEFPVIRMASHKMKGSAGMLGAQALASVCRSLEKAADAGDAALMRILRGQFDTESARVMEALDAF